MTAKLALIEPHTEQGEPTEVKQMQIVDHLFIKSWHTDPNHYQIVITDHKETPLLAEQVPVSSVREHLDAMLKALSKKGIRAKKMYVPIWYLSIFKDTILTIYPRTKVFADYNDDG